MEIIPPDFQETLEALLAKKEAAQEKMFTFSPTDPRFQTHHDLQAMVCEELVQHVEGLFGSLDGFMDFLTATTQAHADARGVDTQDMFSDSYSRYIPATVMQKADKIKSDYNTIFKDALFMIQQTAQRRDNAARYQHISGDPYGTPSP